MSENHPIIDMSWHMADTPLGQAKAGIALRKTTPLESHADWKIVSRRRDVIGLLEEQSAQRVPDLIPLRYYRMSDSAFTFYRGTALIMANDLAHTPTTGIPVQAVGDAHIGNFGMFRSPSDRLVFDINDFDETTTGPWEWDVKRLAVSVEICGRANGIKEKDRRNAVARCVHSYRDHIRQFSQMDFLDVWYDHLDVEAALDHYESTVNGKRNRTLRDAALRASVRDSDHAAAKLTYLDSGEKRLRFRSKPPELVPISELQDYADLGVLRERLDALYDSYRQSLYEDRRYVLNRYRYHDTARKVVGVGSVGTRAWVSILTGRGLDDPLMLQMKEANESVFERFVGRSPYATHGERVVQGAEADPIHRRRAARLGEFRGGGRPAARLLRAPILERQGLDRHRSSERAGIVGPGPHVRMVPGARACPHRRQRGHRQLSWGHRRVRPGDSRVRPSVCGAERGGLLPVQEAHQEGRAPLLEEKRREEVSRGRRPPSRR